VRRLAWALFVLLVLVCQGCANYAQEMGHDAAVSAIAAASEPASRAKLGGLAASVVGSARDEALGPETSRRIQAMVDALGVDLRAQLIATRDALLDDVLRAELRPLGDELEALVRNIVDEALGPDTIARAGRLREEFVGAPLRADVDALGVTMRAQLQTSIAAVRADADADIARYRTVAIWLAVGMGALFVMLGFMGHVLRTHRKMLAHIIEGRATG
jgi:hypothetical protein